MVLLAVESVSNQLGDIQTAVSIIAAAAVAKLFFS